MSKEEQLQAIKTHLSSRFHLSADQVEEMIPAFVVALGEHVAKLEAAMASGDLSEMGKAGHTIKGALLNLGLNECAEIALEIEQKGKAADSTCDFQSMVRQIGDNLQPLFD